MMTRDWLCCAQAELDKTFFLNFGKKGELKDLIKGYKKVRFAWHATMLVSRKSGP